LGDEEYQKKGVDTNFGFKVNEPFYLRTKMSSGRVMEITGGNNVILKAYAKGRTA
jgi:hypothetical protein